MIFTYLLLAFILMPLAELALLMRVHTAVGFTYTIALVILTGFIGAFLARAQGFRVVTQIRRDLDAGRLPAPQLMDGVMILVAGVLLVTPGLITDTVGFLLLMPPVRQSIRLWLRRKVEASMRRGTTTVRWTS